MIDNENWSGKLNVSLIHTGNAMSKKEIMALSNKIGIDQLRNYRTAVGRQTVEIVKQLDPVKIG